MHTASHSPGVEDACITLSYIKRRPSPPSALPIGDSRNTRVESGKPGRSEGGTPEKGVEDLAATRNTEGLSTPASLRLLVIARTPRGLHFCDFCPQMCTCGFPHGFFLKGSTGQSPPLFGPPRAADERSVKQRQDAWRQVGLDLCVLPTQRTLWARISNCNAAKGKEVESSAALSSKEAALAQPIT